MQGLYVLLFFLVELFVMLPILELIISLQTHPTLSDLYIHHMSMVDILANLGSRLCTS